MIFLVLISVGFSWHLQTRVPVWLRTLIVRFPRSRARLDNLVEFLGPSIIDSSFRISVEGLYFICKCCRVACPGHSVDVVKFNFMNTKWKYNHMMWFIGTFGKLSFCLVVMKYPRSWVDTMFICKKRLSRCWGGKPFGDCLDYFSLVLHFRVSWNLATINL